MSRVESAAYKQIQNLSFLQNLTSKSSSCGNSQRKWAASSFFCSCCREATSCLHPWLGEADALRFKLAQSVSQRRKMTVWRSMLREGYGLGNCINLWKTLLCILWHQKSCSEGKIQQYSCVLKAFAGFVITRVSWTKGGGLEQKYLTEFPKNFKHETDNLGFFFFCLFFYLSQKLSCSQHKTLERICY